MLACVSCTWLSSCLWLQGGASVYSHAPVPSARRRIDQKPDNVDADDDAIEEDDLEKVHRSAVTV